jgi:CheY-like chemotaxis protein
MLLENTILLADDFEPHVLLVQLVLRKAGVLNPIRIVNDGDEAIAYLKGEGGFADRSAFPLPTVLFLDLKMPRVSGFQVLEWWRTQPQLKNMLVIILSGYSQLPDVRRAYALGAKSFLTKPCEIQDVINITQAFKGFWRMVPAITSTPPVPPWPADVAVMGR